MKGAFICTKCGNRFELRVEYGWDGSSHPMPHYDLDLALCDGQTVAQEDPRFEATRIRFADVQHDVSKAAKKIQDAIDRAAGTKPR